MKKLNFTPLLIIGAPRSGTNILRDILSFHPSISTWPCDELNQMWRHYNSSSRTDELQVSDATSHVVVFIRKFFADFHRHTKTPFILEKTCANSLRVPFVATVFPEAKYIHIVRNGLDSIPSARICWGIGFRPVYLFKKLRYVPLGDLFSYFHRFFFSYFRRLFSKDKRVGMWGPIYFGMDHDISTKSLLEVCSIQWQKCVDSATTDLRSINSSSVFYLRYEDLVLNPVSTITAIFRFLGLENPEYYASSFSSLINPNSIGKGSRSISKSDCALIQSIVGQTLISHGYEINTEN